MRIDFARPRVHRPLSSTPRWLKACALSALAICSVQPTSAQSDDDWLKKQVRLEDYQARKQQVDTELAGLGASRSQLRADLRAHGRALYRLSRGGLLPLAGGLDALLTHAANLRRLEQLVERDLNELRKLKERGNALRAETAELAGKISVNEHYLTGLRRASRRGTSEQRAEAEFQHAFTSSQTLGTRTLRTASGTLSILDDEAAGSRFSDHRGNLALPVSGPTQVREASRAESEGIGLELITKPGVTVRASAPGRVAFAGRYASYGRIVILDHGDRYYTVYAGLGDVQVRAGDDLSRSARVGSVGGEGVLYFEVRKGTRNLSARAWLGL